MQYRDERLHDWLERYAAWIGAALALVAGVGVALVISFLAGRH